MLKQKTIDIYRISYTSIVEHFPLIISVVFLAVAAVMTFVSQNQIVGFEPGYDELAPKHHGSVSSRGLAIISQATPENGFVGYAIQYKNDQDQLVYDYFDRYPVLFSAVFNRVLALRPKLSSQIYLAKQVMNFIFVATMLVAFLLCDKLINHKPLALFAVLITFSNPYLLFYKDMVHFDQPALFGFLLLTYAIALYKIDGLKYPIYIATILAVALGRGYASFAVLGLWLLIEAFLILKTRGLSLGQKVKQVLKHPSFLLLMIGILWGGSLLSYNIIVEAQKRNVPILQTSIIDSAGRRLSLNQEFNQEYEPIINWPGYAATEITRIIKWASPKKWANPQVLESSLLLLIMFLLIGLAARKQTIEKRIIFIIMALSGFVWLIPMRNLAAFHDYTTMYFIGLTLAFFLSLALLLKPSRDAANYFALLGLVVYLSGIAGVRDLHEINADKASQYTYDFMRIQDGIGSQGNNVYMQGTIPYTTNAEEFYLQSQYLSPLTLADYVISGDRDYLPDNLTPDNSVMFLFKNTR